MSDASIIEEIDEESMNLQTECFNFLNKYESSFNNVPDKEPIETSNFESEKIPTNPTFLQCNICKNKHTRFFTQTELDKHIATFHVQKTVNGFKVISLSKNINEGTKEIVFEKHESNHQMKDIQEKNEGEVGTPKSKRKKLIPHLKCSECDNTFGKNHILEHHMRVIHKKTQEEIDHFYQFEKKSIEEHVLKVQEGKRLVKIEREERSIYDSLNRKEMNDRKEERMPETSKVSYSCQICKKTFNQKELANRHVAIVHEKKKLFKCSACEKSFSKVSNMQVHFEFVHEGKKRFECNLCGKKFTRQQSLDHHIASIHEGKKPNLCPFCGHATFQAPNLKKHIAMVREGQRPYSCDACEKTFKIKPHLKNHKARAHDGKKPFKCPTCDKAFSVQRDMKKHSFIHTNIRPYECNACDAKFKRRVHLKTHLRTIHGLVK